MNKKEIIVTILSGVLLFGIAAMRPAKFAAETTFFVPLTLLEKQINQNGIGFGSPIEVDAHLELMQSPRVIQVLQSKFNEAFDLDVRKTKNGAVAVEIRSSDPIVAAEICNASIAITDSIKQDMLRQNVGMSLEVILNRAQLLEAEEKALRKELDSLRIFSQDDSLSFAALIFRKERQYGTAVIELTKVERKLEDLKGYTDAPAPKSYIISPAIPSNKKVGLPSWAIGLLGAAIVGIAIAVWRSTSS